jgi:hypothetical protein
MVILNCKRLPKEEYSKDYDEFLFRVANTTNVGEATDAVQRVQNTRVRLKWMVAAAKQLAKDSCPDDLKHILTGPAEEAERYLSLERSMEQKLETTEEELAALIATVKGGVTIVFPADCSGPNALRTLSAVLDNDDASDVQKSKAHRILSIIDDGATTEDILVGPAVMWWSGKPLDRSCDFTKYTGKNDKTKIVVKLSKEGASAPPREPAIDAKTQNEMMAFWYRKQEEQKKLVEDDDLSFGNSEWANSKGLKNQLLGFEQVKFKPR